MSNELTTAATSPAASGVPPNAPTAPAAAPAAAAQPAAADAAPANGTPPSLLDAPAAAPAVPPATPQTATPPAEPAPDAYDLKPLEGTQFDETLLGELKALAKASNMPKEQAQQLAEMGQKSVQRYQARVAEQVEQQQRQWVDASRGDKEFGGDQLNANLAIAKRARDALGTPELTQLLNESGLGNHPEVIRFFFRAGQAISEDRLVPGGVKPNGAEKSIAQRLYPNMNP